MKKPSLLLLTPGFPANENDTVTVPYIQDWIEEAKAVFEIKVISFQFPFEEKVYDWKGVEVYSAGGKNKSFPLRLITWRKVWRKMKAWHKQYVFEGILCFWLTETSLLGEYFSRRNPTIKLFRWALGQDTKKNNGYLRLINLKWGKVFYLSTRGGYMNVDKSEVMLLGLPKSINNIDISKERRIDVLGIGGHIPLKRYDLFLKTIAALKIDFPAIRCVLVGSGTETSNLKALCEELDLNNNVTFIATLTREEIFTIMAESKIFFHTSSYEGQGMVMTECLQLGCYLVCGDVGYIHHSPKTFVCERDELFAGVIRGILLKDKMDFNAVRMLSMRESVAQFSNQFESIKKGQ